MMFHFLPGWRQKAGCIALVIVLALFGAWMRSYTTRDRYHFRMGLTHCCITSESGRIRWSRHDVVEFCLYRVFRTDLDNCEDYLEDLQLTSSADRWEYSDFMFCAIHDDGLSAWVWVFPYWLLVLPLTLLSAYLILWNPKKRT